MDRREGNGVVTAIVLVIPFHLAMDQIQAQLIAEIDTTTTVDSGVLVTIVILQDVIGRTTIEAICCVVCRCQEKIRKFIATADTATDLSRIECSYLRIQIGIETLLDLS